MGYRNLQECVRDLEKSGQLLRIEEEIDPHLEVAEIQRRVCAADGPAIFYSHVKNCLFPMVSNLFGTWERTQFLFRDTLQAVEKLVELKIDPMQFWKNPWRYRSVPRLLWSMRPRTRSHGPILRNETTVDRLPQLVSWPNDGGAFVTLPEVYTEHPEQPGFAKSNLGMYRIQLSGGEYKPNSEVGLHYQIQRSIAAHHAAAIRMGKPLKVNIFVGGSPSVMLAAVMPLPDNLSELTFAGALGRRRIGMIKQNHSLPIYAEADFCIAGTVDPDRLLPEGPFGDHLGYYSMQHDFPVLKVEKVFHRNDAVWPFTTVGRPPQEDTNFGRIVHQLTGPAVHTVVNGVHAIHAVDAAGVHPLLLAVGSERYVPYAKERQPQELLTCANAILGQGQLSLAKYLFIVAKEDDPKIDIDDIANFFKHVLQRVDWQRDLHFHTRTTIDTLDYSGSGLNAGSKLVIAAAGQVRRELPVEIPSDLTLPKRFEKPRVCLPGILAVQTASCSAPNSDIGREPERFCGELGPKHAVNRFPLIVLVDDSEFTARSLRNFLWVTFTRSNPASDTYGIAPSYEDKHWGCNGSLVIDARIKPHHSPPLTEDPKVTKRVDNLAAPGGPLHGVI